MKTFFISDLHLSQKTPNVADLFQYFIEHIFTVGDQLFILGDFFEYYLGPDLLDPVQTTALKTLKQLADQGSKVFFMHGNRDFLITKHTLAKYHVTLLNDPTYLTLGKQTVLLSHGDTLCTQDKAYQRYRRFAHLGFIKWFFLHLPRHLRKQIAEQIHVQNPHQEAMSDPNYTLADATPEAIEQTLKAFQPDIFIYGHVHKMGEYQHGKTKRLVLGDWYHTGNYLELTQTGKITAKVFSLPATQV